MRRRRRTPLERRRRLAARLALYGSLALATGLLFGLRWFLGATAGQALHQWWGSVDFASLPEVRLLRSYVAIDTTADRGDEVAGARFLAAQLAAAGIPSTLEILGEGKANLWAVLEGEEPEAVVLHQHLDTDPVPNPEEWDFPPFAGEISLPWIYGRGTFDMKSVGIAQLLAFAALKDGGRPLRRSVILLATGSEERGSELGTRWILAQHPELVSRFWVVLTEGGVVEARSPDDIKYWGTEFAQKRYPELTVCSGSRERLQELRREILERGQPAARLRLTPEVDSFLDAYAPSRDLERLRNLLAEPRRLIRDRTAYDGLPRYLRSMFRDEVAAFPVAAAQGGGYELPLKLHLLPGSRLEEARQELVPAWMTHGLAEVLYDSGAADGGSSLDHPAFREILALLERHHPGVPKGPFFLPWTATDARFFRAAGIAAYGFSPFLILTTDTLHVGGVNERIALPGYVQGVRLYRELARRLAG